MSNTVADLRTRAIMDVRRNEEAVRLRTIIIESGKTIEWRLALVDLACLTGVLPQDIPVHRVSLFHTTTLQ